MGHGFRDLPYPARVFGLPKTHVIAHTSPDGAEHIEFLLWALSFILGMRLTATEAGFVDSTPIRPGKLVDFVTADKSFEVLLGKAEAFWQSNKIRPHCAKTFGAAVHALFLAQHPRSLQFEKFIYLYTAIDACYALASTLHAPPSRLSHARRIVWMCDLFRMTSPDWGTPTGSSTEVSRLRNATIHEALFAGEPLGFSTGTSGSNRNMPLEMEALVCRLLVSLLGGSSSDYVRTPVNTRSKHRLTL